MLFNSYEFIFIFLPLTLIVFHLVGGQGHHRVAISWLVAASLFFYSWWNPAYLGLMLISILFNYAIGVSLNSGEKNNKKVVLYFGVLVNIAILVYFKYANFFVDNLNAIADSEIILQTIILPLAISFFTFQQIAYLVDTSRGETRECNFLHYCLFVTFFPQLIAGPIVHHKEMLPQFARNDVYRLRAKHLAVGFTIFTIGLFKKVVLADSVAGYATSVFNVAETGAALTFLEAWGGALAYTLQLYFDFSGYSDMAIGLARMFGIRLPLNFNSPYKSTSIIDFWRRWHITLSRFLRDYLYIPLGGSHRGKIRRHINLLITMLLGGLWHGAGWTFLLWGGLHGLYLIINHFWRGIIGVNKVPVILGWGLTMLAIIISWVLFRAESLAGAGNMLGGMAGLQGISLPAPLIGKLGVLEAWLYAQGVVFHGTAAFGSLAEGGPLILALIIVAIAFPNTQQILRRYRPAFETYKGEIKRAQFKWLEWRPTLSWIVIILSALTISVFEMTNISEFLYFRF